MIKLIHIIRRVTKLITTEDVSQLKVSQGSPIWGFDVGVKKLSLFIVLMNAREVNCSSGELKFNFAEIESKWLNTCPFELFLIIFWFAVLTQVCIFLLSMERTVLIRLLLKLLS